ncbi:MAG: ECF-type sigma factor [Wenzhouxiangellaceae bacterium]
MTDEKFEPLPDREITAMLEHVRSSDEEFGEVIRLVYDDLKRIGHNQRFRFNAGDTLQTTALVNEAFMKLQAGSGQRIENSNHLRRLAAVVMRQLILDHARREQSQKRGAGQRAETLDEQRAGAAERDAGVVLEIERALRRLEQVSPRMAEIAGAKMFAGYTLEEIAGLVGCSPRTARREFKRAQAWLKMELAEYEQRA